MSEERARRLQSLFAQRAGAGRRDLLESLLGSAATSGWRIVPATDSSDTVDRLKQAARRARAADSMTAPKELSLGDFQETVKTMIATREGDFPMLVATSKVQEIGLIEIKPSVLVATLVKIIEIDGDSILVMPPSAEWGIMVQLDEDAGDRPYLLESWGF